MVILKSLEKIPANKDKQFSKLLEQWHAIAPMLTHKKKKSIDIFIEY